MQAFLHPPEVSAAGSSAGRGSAGSTGGLAETTQHLDSYSVLVVRRESRGVLNGSCWNALSCLYQALMLRVGILVVFCFDGHPNPDPGVLRNILRLAVEDLPSSPPQVKPRVPNGQPAAQAEPLLSMLSPTDTPRRPQTLPPLEARGRPEGPARLGRSQSRGRTLSRASSQGRLSRAGSRGSHASHASRTNRISRTSSRARSVEAQRLPKRSGSVQSLQSRISAEAAQI